jgi:hypothetical protein
MFSCKLSNDELEKIVIELVNGDKTLEILNQSLNLSAFYQSAAEPVQFIKNQSENHEEDNSSESSDEDQGK